MATLLAFARDLGAATVDVTNTQLIDTWTYDSRVLAILAAPLLATLLVLCKHWRVQSNDIVIGYDPLAIARRADDLLATSDHVKAFARESESHAYSTWRGAYSALVTQSSKLVDSVGHGFGVKLESTPLRGFTTPNASQPRTSLLHSEEAGFRPTQ